MLFDFAGTLMVPRPAAELLARAAARAGLSLTAAELAQLADAYVAAGIPGAPYPRHVPDELVELYERRDLSPDNHRRAYVGLLETVHRPQPRSLPAAVYEQILEPDGWVPYRDAGETVAEIVRRGVRVGVVSNVGFDIRPILRHHGLGTLTGSCTLSFEVGCVKPEPAIFRTALAQLGTPAARTLMVGDHEQADGGARAVGIATLILPMTGPGTTHGLGRVLEASNRLQHPPSAQ